MTTKTIIVCVNHRSNPNQPSCGARGGIKIADYIERQVIESQLSLSVERFYCLGFCERGPNLKVSPKGRFVHDAKIEDLESLFKELVDHTTE